jgi:hypothetical protein
MADYLTKAQLKQREDQIREEKIAAEKNQWLLDQVALQANQQQAIGTTTYNSQGGILNNGKLRAGSSNILTGSMGLFGDVTTNSGKVKRIPNKLG